jgi:hypothetical protein
LTAKELSEQSYSKSLTGALRAEMAGCILSVNREVKTGIAATCGKNPESSSEENSP